MFLQEYYANTGALKKAAENNGREGRKVSVSVIESFEREVKPRDLEETLRLEYRSKLLNPKWAEAMIAQVMIVHALTIIIIVHVSINNYNNYPSYNTVD